MSDLSGITHNYLDQLTLALTGFPEGEVLKVAGILIKGLNEGTIYVAGNGGSASTASHMATDLGVGSLRRNNPLRIVSLVDNTAVLTATANDLSFNQIFSQQIRLLGRKGDIFLCFSASGNSMNLVNAVEEAKKMEITTISVTGFDGGTLRNISDFNIHIETAIGSYGIVEDIHSTISHMLTEIIRSPR
jgi:D-sedoheptulose 7-phosphate isomerase